MSQLSQLIEQARKTRRLEDIFNIKPAQAQSELSTSDSDRLLRSLTDLESNLLANPAFSRQAVNDLVSELEAIASGL